MSAPQPDLLAWVSAAIMALLTGLLILRDGRRRVAINEAIHELRRPLQALALAGPRDGAGIGESSIRLAAAALERLDHEVNGGERAPRRERIGCEELLSAAVRRWRAGAALEGAELGLRWRAGAVSVDGDPIELGQALDNLIVNAIEHGGPRIVVEGSAGRDRVRLLVVDSGRSRRPALRGDAFSVAVERFSGRRRRGHGLAVVRRAAARHGGRFVLEHSSGGSRAVLELPRAAGLRVQRSG